VVPSFTVVTTGNCFLAVTATSDPDRRRWTAWPVWWTGSADKAGSRLVTVVARGDSSGGGP
jgi:hypothetical protein